MGAVSSRWVVCIPLASAVCNESRRMAEENRCHGVPRD
ncbi:hypothetical protein, unlikely [Trypanosoma brucei brucei TREU927]|uniref:Uncharacterized protein n=1 Tax=Trypanosoma brucei brucei (strain 927/4 GUTat10.1) TaxID=185431 RepID=Q38F60_TRYB2|nr:hypothetical protein, unlikely [Trypanosoma brucei brucei TREU927]EAN76560.1 hypothetical protein, unlikely [Trypanosoma brucei brucei TREU927]